MRDQPRGNLLGLKVLVGIMGVLIVLGTAVVAGTVVHRLYARKAAPSRQEAMPVAVAGSVALEAGEKIQGIAGTGDEIAVWVSGPGGGRVLLIDPSNGRVSVGLREAPLQ